MNGPIHITMGSSMDAAIALRNTASINFLGYGPNLITESTFSGGTYTPWYSHSGEATLTVVSGALQITYGTAINNFAEYALTLVVDSWYRISLDVTVAITNKMRIRVNTTANDHSSMVYEWGYAPAGTREMWFKATATTMYLAIGDDNGFGGSTNITIDNVAVQLDNTYVAPSSNPYLETVTIPTYSAVDSTHCIIPDDEPWAAATFNSAAYSHFYVRPQSSAAEVTITASGTAIARKTISLYNDNDLHPGQLQASERAMMKIIFDGASYWDVDRPALWSDNNSMIRFNNGSSYNTVNRAYGSVGQKWISVTDACHNNTIQKSRFESTTGADAPAVQIFEWGVASYEAKNTKVIECEFYNCIDGVQTVRSPYPAYPAYQDANCEGTIVDSCHFHIDADTVTGTENAIDLKVGSTNAANRCKVTNNIIWGYIGSGTQSQDPVTIHYDVWNTDWTDNITFNCSEGFGSGSAGGASGFNYGLRDSTVKRNLFYACGVSNDYVFILGSSDNVKVEDNIFIDCGYGYGDFYGNDADTTFTNNDLCNTNATWNDAGSNNSAFLATVTANAAANTYASATAGGYTADIVFNTDIYTNNQTQHTLTKAAKP